MATTLLPAGVEKRLKTQAETWHRLARRAERDKEKTPAAPFITLSRQYGCAAYVLAEHLARRLNSRFPQWDFTVYDHKLLEIVEENRQVKADLVDSLSRHSRSLMEEWLEFLFAARPTEIQLFHHLAKTLCSVASLGEAIIVGRGSAVITRRLPAGLHVRLIAPLAWRIENLRRDPERAHLADEATVRRADREREDFVRRYLGTDIADPELYHLTLNNQLLSVEEQVETIVGLVETRARHQGRDEP